MWHAPSWRLGGMNTRFTPIQTTEISRQNAITPSPYMPAGERRARYPMSDLMRAQAFCIAAHCAVGQKRKYTGEDYYLHPIQVAELIQEHATTFTEEMIIAAHLHDVVEDTQVELSIIARQFGSVVASYVEQLTDVSRPEDGNRAARKAIDLAHTALASPQAHTIKLADLISNTRSIVERDPVFAVTYLAEKRKLLEVLKDGDPNLYRIAYDLAYSA